MRVLYCAIDQAVPGSHGGSVHVQAVAEGLARLGHEVHVATRMNGPAPAGPVWHSLGAPLSMAHLRLLRARTVTRLRNARAANEHCRLLAGSVRRLQELKSRSTRFAATRTIAGSWGWRASGALASCLPGNVDDRSGTRHAEGGPHRG